MSIPTNYAVKWNPNQRIDLYDLQQEQIGLKRRIGTSVLGQYNDFVGSQAVGLKGVVHSGFLISDAGGGRFTISGEGMAVDRDANLIIQNAASPYTSPALTNGVLYTVYAYYAEAGATPTENRRFWNGSAEVTTAVTVRTNAGYGIHYASGGRVDSYNPGSGAVPVIALYEIQFTAGVLTSITDLRPRDRFLSANTVAGVIDSNAYNWSQNVASIVSWTRGTGALTGTLVNTAKSGFIAMLDTDLATPRLRYFTAAPGAGTVTFYETGLTFTPASKYLEIKATRLTLPSDVVSSAALGITAGTTLTLKATGASKAALEATDTGGTVGVKGHGAVDVESTTSTVSCKGSSVWLMANGLTRVVADPDKVQLRGIGGAVAADMVNIFPDSPMTGTSRLLRVGNASGLSEVFGVTKDGAIVTGALSVSGKATSSATVTGDSTTTLTTKGYIEGYVDGKFPIPNLNTNLAHFTPASNSGWSLSILRVWKDATNTVHVRGVIQANRDNPSLTLGTFDAGYRPSTANNSYYRFIAARVTGSAYPGYLISCMVSGGGTLMVNNVTFNGPFSGNENYGANLSFLNGHIVWFNFSFPAEE